MASKRAKAEPKKVFVCQSCGRSPCVYLDRWCAGCAPGYRALHAKSGRPTIDGVETKPGVRFMLRNQKPPTKNGVYRVSESVGPTNGQLILEALRIGSDMVKSMSRMANDLNSIGLLLGSHPDLHARRKASRKAEDTRHLVAIATELLQEQWQYIASPNGSSSANLAKLARRGKEWQEDSAKLLRTLRNE